jgi:hypothetical protein
VTVYKSIRRTVLLAALTIGLGIAVAPAAPASAATTSLACTPQGAPTLDSGTFATAHYFYGCNVNPSLVGVTKIEELLQIRGSGTYGRDIPRTSTQQSAATAIQYCDNRVLLCRSNADNISLIAVPAGPYAAWEVVKFTGSFPYGRVPGCGRVSPTEVDCVWHSATGSVG